MGQSGTLLTCSVIEICSVLLACSVIERRTLSAFSSVREPYGFDCGIGLKLGLRSLGLKLVLKLKLKLMLGLMIRPTLQV